MISKIKKIIVFVIGLLVSFCMYIYWFVFSGKQKKIAIFDIDNTLALSALFLYNGKCSISNVPANKSIKKILLEKKEYGHKIIFLSHRPFHHFHSTFFWIKNNIVTNVRKKDIIFVPEVKFKLYFLKLFLKKGTISYYDDLHYGFELPEGPFAYKEIISKIEEMDIEYYGYDYIKRFKN